MRAGEFYVGRKRLVCCGVVQSTTHLFGILFGAYSCDVPSSGVVFGYSRFHHRLRNTSLRMIRDGYFGFSLGADMSTEDCIHSASVSRQKGTDLSKNLESTSFELGSFLA